MKQKLLSTRNVVLALLSVLLALCLAVGIFILPKKANAAEGDDNTLTLSDAKDFEIDEENGVLLGLSDAGKAKIADVESYSVEMPEGVYVGAIGKGAFKGDEKLYGINLNGIYAVNGEAFSGCKSLVSVQLPDILNRLGTTETTEIPGENPGEVSWITIEYGDVFSGCTSLQSINIPYQIGTIPVNCFKGCSSLATVTFDEQYDEHDDYHYRAIHNIYESAFEGTALTSVEIPDGVSKIAANAFAQTNLTSVSIPASVYQIGKNAFGDIAFENIDYKCSIGLLLDCYSDNTFGNLDLSDSTYAISWDVENTAPLKFEAGSTVILPKKEGDFPNEMIVATLLKFSNATTLVVPDSSTYYTIEGLSWPLDEEEMSGDTYLANMDDATIIERLASVKNKIIGNVVTIKFIVEDVFGNTYELEEKKLEGKSYKWVQNEDGTWGEKADYHLPSVVQGVNVKSNKWILRDSNATVSVDNTVDAAHTELYQKIYANVAVPEEQEIVYSGSAYALSDELAEVMEITKITDSEGNPVDIADVKDAGTYTVYVALKNGKDYWEGDRLGDEINDVKQFIWADGLWIAGSDDIVLEGTWVCRQVGTDKAAEWVTKHWVYEGGKPVEKTGFTLNDLTSRLLIGGEVIDGELVGAEDVRSIYTGGTWSADSFNVKSYQLVISPKTVELEWRNNGVKIPDVNNYELNYSKSNTTDLFSAYINDNKSALTVGEGLVITNKDGNYDKNVLVEGVYVITASHNNYTFINPTFGVRINAATVDLSGEDILSWSVNSGSLTGGTVYISKQGENVVVHTLHHLGIAYTDIKDVENSIVRYTGKEITLLLTVDENAGYNVSLSGNVETNSGMYTATATLTAKAGYRFTTSIENIENNNFAEHGITVTIDEDGKTANVTKTWYIIEAENELLDSAKSIAAKEWVEYSIEGWTYGDTVSVSLPRLAHGDEGDNWQNNDGNVTFELKRGNTTVASNIKRSELNAKLNGLSAGDYELIAKVENVETEGEHTHWWDNKTHTTDKMVHNFERKYYFTVAEAAIQLEPDANTGYVEYKWELAASKAGFFADFKKFVEENISLTNGITEYTLSYNLSRMNDNEYYHDDNTKLTDLIKGGAEGTYTVYFSIEAPNHVTIGGAQDINRLKYFFTVTVWEEIDPADITVGDVDYTGGRVVPVIAADNRFEVIWTANDSYINGGSHNVSLKLYDTDHYIWKGENSDTVTKTFQITQANNDKWAQAPGVIGWEHGYFDKTKNLFTAVPKFLDEGEAVHFAVKNSEGKTEEGLEDMTAVNGVIADKFITALNKLPAGSYTLAVTVNPTANYLGNSANVTFAVSKSTNTWAITPNVMQWRYGSYNNVINLILGEAKIVDTSNPVIFKVTSDEEGETVLIDSFSLEDGIVPDDVATKLGELTVGKYYLWSSVAATASYSELKPDEPFEFAVSEAINDWTVAPNAIGWAYGSYDKSANSILGSVINGTVTFSVAKDGNAIKGLEGFTYVTNEIAGILAKLDAGAYSVTAKVDANENYQDVNTGTATLTISQAVNAWVETPSIISWVKGQYNPEENVITVSDSFGSHVNIVIYQSDDETNIIYQEKDGEVIVDNLATAEIGHYTLEATVVETGNYSGLEKTFRFQIFAPEGLAWWAWLLIIVAILGVIALVFWILHEKGVLQMLTGRFVIAMRTKMTVDATIAAVRANMVAENSKKTRAAAERRDRLEALRKAREEGDTRSPEELAAALEEKARVAAEKAEKMQKRANRMQKRAEKARDKAETTADNETTAEDATPETTDEGETPDEN